MVISSPGVHSEGAGTDVYLLHRWGARCALRRPLPCSVRGDGERRFERKHPPGCYPAPQGRTADGWAWWS